MPLAVAAPPCFTGSEEGRYDSDRAYDEPLTKLLKANGGGMSETKRFRLRVASKVLMGIAIVFWLWFGVGSAAGEGLGWVHRLVRILVPAGLFILSTLAAFRRVGIGRTLLMLEGVLATAFVVRNFDAGRSSPSTVALMLLSLAFPPLAAGIMFPSSLREPRLLTGRTF